MTATVMNPVPLERGRQLDAFYAVGKLLYDQGDVGRAADVFRFVVLMDDRRPEAWLALGACHEQLEDLDIAAAIYEAGFRVSGPDAALGLLGARAWALSGDASAASDLLDTVTELELEASERQRLAAVRAMLERGRS